MTTLSQLLRAIRDLGIAVLGLLLAIATRVGGGALKAAWIIFACCLVAGAIAALLSCIWLPSNKRREVRSTRVKKGLWGLEAEVVLLHSSGAILIFAAAFFLLGNLAGDLTENTEKYWFGAASGFILASLSTAIINPGKDLHWIENYTRKRLGKSFDKYFGAIPDEDHSKLKRTTPHSRWDPLTGVERLALSLHSYEDGGKRVEGWKWRARRDRCDTLIRGLGSDVIPENGKTRPAE